MNKKISINCLKKHLHPKELKNVLGGSGGSNGGCDAGLCWVRCNNGDAGCTNDCEKTCSTRGGIKKDDLGDICWC